jgi:hypothetical protein
MALWVILKRADDFKAMSLVEPWCLERMGVKCKLVAPVTSGFSLGRS